MDAAIAKRHTLCL